MSYLIQILKSFVEVFWPFSFCAFSVRFFRRGVLRFSFSFFGPDAEAEDNDDGEDEAAEEAGEAVRGVTACQMRSRSLERNEN